MNVQLPIRTLIITTIVVCWASVARIDAARTFDLTTASITDITAADLLDWTLKGERLDAFVGPTIGPARLISEESTPESRGFRDLASIVGWPDLSVPAGFTKDPMLPVGLSFLGPPFSEARVLALGYAFERAQPMRRLPGTTPALPGERFEY
jgi:Asp-tRNA(Asn)/Glu-tRNA(Gln) amidotransferase A subunit family amidase